jgi:hypothetical protein
MNLQYLPAASALIGGNDAVDPAHVRPGQQAPVPADESTLLIEALRTINRMSVLLNEIAAWAHKQADDAWEDTQSSAGTPGQRFSALADLNDLTIRRFSDASGLHVFIAAGNLGIELPPDIDGSRKEDGDDDC